MTTQKIIDQYSRFSSPSELSNYKISVLKKHDCCCDSCGKSIFEMDDFPQVKRSEVLCEYCEREKYFETCPICEEYFEKPKKTTDEFVIISKESVKEYGMNVKPGFYQVLEHPYFLANCVTGFDALFEDAIKLIRECDINSMLYKLYPHNGQTKVTADSCCPDCMKKYTGQTRIENNYCNKSYGKKRVMLERQVIKDGL